MTGRNYYYLCYSNVSDLKSAVRDESEQFGELSRQQSQISQAKMADFDRQLEDVVQQEAQIQTDAARFSEETVQVTSSRPLQNFSFF